MPRYHPIIVCAILASTLAAKADGDDVLGDIAVRLGTHDLVWRVVAASEHAATLQSGYRDFGFVWQVRLEALNDGEDGPAGLLQVVFSGPNGETAPNERLIAFEDGASGKRYVSSDDDTDAVIVEQLYLGEQTGFASGRLNATLCAREGIFAVVDPEDCLSIEGRFAARLPVDG